MTIVENIVERVEFLEYKEKSNGGNSRRSLRGMWKNVDISEADIDEARREMWGNFPREDF